MRYLNLIHGGPDVGSWFFFSIQTLFLHSLLLSFFFPGSVCCVTQGTILYQPRCSHCICQGLILVTNLAQVCLWFSWNSWYLGNKQVALTHGMCLLREGANTSPGPPGVFPRKSVELGRALVPSQSIPLPVSRGENEIPDPGTVTGLSWPYLGVILGPI